MSDLWKGIMWIAVAIVVVAGMIITGKVDCLIILVFPFLISFLDSM